MSINTTYLNPSDMSHQGTAANTAFVLFFSCLCVTGCKNDARIISASETTSATSHDVSLGDSKSEFDAIITVCGGKDITPGLAIEGPNGEHPLHGFVWMFPSYQCVLSVRFNDANSLTHMVFCPLSDFNHSKSHRHESTLNITEIEFQSDNSTKYKRVKAK